jgi:hypothetical protein
LAGIAKSIADEGKGLWKWGGDLKNDCVDYSVRKKNIFKFLLWSGTFFYTLVSDFNSSLISCFSLQRAETARTSTIQYVHQFYSFKTYLFFITETCHRDRFFLFFEKFPQGARALNLICSSFWFLLGKWHPAINTI